MLQPFYCRMMQTVPRTQQTVPPLLQNENNQLLCKQKEVITLSEKLSCMIADFLLKDNAIAKEEYEIYQYGFELLMYCIEQTMLLLILGILMHQFWLTIVFVFVFVSLRQYTGGYHADTRIGCTIMTVCCYLTVMLLVTMGKSILGNSGVMACVILFYWIVFSNYVPIEHKNKPMTDKQKRINRKIGIGLSVIYMIIALLTYSYSKTIGCGIIVTMFIIAMLIIIQRRKEDNQT